jgi:predicted amidophosphoribosyltransferase
MDDFFFTYNCEGCKEEVPNDFNYCPNCGKEMQYSQIDPHKFKMKVLELLQELRETTIKKKRAMYIEGFSSDEIKRVIQNHTDNRQVLADQAMDKIEEINWWWYN